MKLFQLLNYEKWAQTRLAGRRRYVGRKLLRHGAVHIAFLLLIYGWLAFRLHVAQNPRAVVPFIVATVAVLGISWLVVLWLLLNAGWAFNEWLFRRHLERTTAAPQPQLISPR